ncbi:hypothetical protein [Thiolapillus sp.]|uniref:hypothetical protein n=1 Tax=Thiolapillus sp. TaxID=2017437 RepID=UPI003AF416D3
MMMDDAYFENLRGAHDAMRRSNEEQRMSMEVERRVQMEVDRRLRIAAAKRRDDECKKNELDRVSGALIWSEIWSDAVWMGRS